MSCQTTQLLHAWSVVGRTRQPDHGWVGEALQHEYAHALKPEALSGRQSVDALGDTDLPRARQLRQAAGGSHDSPVDVPVFRQRFAGLVALPPPAERGCVALRFEPELRSSALPPQTAVGEDPLRAGLREPPRPLCRIRQRRRQPPAWMPSG